MRQKISARGEEAKPPAPGCGGSVRLSVIKRGKRGVLLTPRGSSGKSMTCSNPIQKSIQCDDFSESRNETKG